MSIIYRTALALVLILGFSSAHATLLGEDVRYQHHYSTKGDVTPFYGTHVATVGAGVEFIGTDYYDIDLSDTGVYVDFKRAATWGSGAFNGIQLFDINSVIGDFTSFTLIGTNMSGLDQSRITFDPDALWVNWNGLSFTTDTYISLTVATDEGSVPVPAPLALIGLGLFIIGYHRKKSA
ncbi:MAG: PEP-CTERM sorting domain-containing protein [Gammaproteobacteria bacterium]|nr:PEP-CTERM sorting domain-containing protein [Gammaproteobacteria bacterium]